MAYVMIAVPAELVPAVTEFIQQQDGTRKRAAVPESDEDGLLYGWTEDLLRRAYGESGEPMKKLLVFLAESPESEFNSDEIAQGIGVTDWNSVAGMLGAFGRRVSNRYGRARPPWVERRDDLQGGKWVKRMPADVASIILDEANE
jgi:hypothetical protein